MEIPFIDSHTEGEPTRVILADDLGISGDSAAEKLADLRRRFDGLRSFICNEPRGHDAVVGAYVFLGEGAPPQVVFFNNVGYLGMCGHGTIGVATTLRHLGLGGTGPQPLDTPAGPVVFRHEADGSVSVDNVESFRSLAGVRIETEDHGEIEGDVAYGGNWFFLAEVPHVDLSLGNLTALLRLGQDIRRSLDRLGISGAGGAVIDHVELGGPPRRDDCDGRNFVLCPGLEYDRSPCGTGTSAKMACLAADGRLAEGGLWRQESIIGSRFVGRVRAGRKGVLPTITGRAWITAEGRLIGAADDPFREGIRK